MARKLTVVTDETQTQPPKAAKSISESLSMDERSVLVTLRAHAATELDSGRVPAHAIGGLMRQLRDLDREIRALDLRAAEDAKNRDDAEVADGEFDASAV